MSEHLAFYRKYRGLNFSEVVGQEHITDVLDTAIKNGRISHAYLFTGPRGVGKTSVARILAHKINDIDYELESNHIDIIEIDAASNRRIDEIRDLREKVHIAPALAKYKIYIIDEVHMLTKEAFNALLKTLEEPPSHVIFILATTELHKLPVTIVSRTQRHSFRPIDLDSVMKHLKSISEKEGFTVEDDALELIAKHGDGSFRDSISLLDQAASLSAGKSITKSEVEGMLGLSARETIERIISAVVSGDFDGIIKNLESVTKNGAQPEVFAKQILDGIRKHDDYVKLLPLASDLMDVASSPSPTIKLEVVLLDFARKQSGVDMQIKKSIKPAAVSAPKEEKKVEKIEDVKVENEAPTAQVEPVNESLPPQEASEVAQEEPTEDKKSSATEQEVVSAEVEVVPASSGVSIENWPALVEAVKKKNSAFASILRMSMVEMLDGGKVRINVKFKFHKSKIEGTDAMDIIRAAAQEVFGSTPEFIVEVGKAETTQAVSDNKDAEDIADKVISTFGGGERVEL